jgi:zinc/manganese transport system ATP-binding protein
MSIALSLENIYFRYQQDWILEQFSADIALEECCLITGDNGSGKTSLLKLIEGELQPQRGTIRRHPGLKNSCAYLSQFHSFDLQIPVTTLEMLSMGLWKTAGTFKKINASAMQKIHQAIDMTGLTGLENHLVSELSGGQLQRARFARTWLQDEALILLDEPFSSVDKKTTIIIWQMIQRWQADGKTLLIVLHEHPVPDFIQYRSIDLHQARTQIHV